MVRVIVIGARRRRQGLGEFVASAFHRAGAEIAGVVGSSAESAAAAAAALDERYGIACRSFGRLEDALAEGADVVAICSPIETHAGYLGVASEARVHCLAEKPLLWSDNPDELPGGGGERSELLDRVGVIVDRFAANGRYLRTLTQWPTTLDAYFAVHPDRRGVTPERFEMHLSPITEGVKMALDSVSHPLSLLEALCGVGEVEETRAVLNDSGDLTLGFRYVHGRGRGITDTSVRLVRHEGPPPRPAGYAIDGRAVERTIEMPSYATTFVATDGSGRSAPVPDPVTEIVNGFLSDLRAGRETDRESLSSGMRGLERLVDATARAVAAG